MKDNGNTSKPILQFKVDDVTVSKVDTMYQGFFKLNQYHLRHKLFSGEYSQSITREVFERGDAVVVIPYDVNLDKILLIEQFRPGALRTCTHNVSQSPWQLEFIAGMFEAHESPIEVAIREAKEEANIDIKTENIMPIMQYLSSPGGMSETIHLYLAKINSKEVEVGAVFGLAHENEDILLHLIGRVEALELLTQGKITNAATIIGLQWLAMHYQEL